MAQFFAEGGFWMYPIALLGLAAVVLGAMGLATQSKGTSMAALVCAAIVTLLGVSGMMWGRRAVDDALLAVAPQDADVIRVVGYREAMRPAQLAGGFVVLGAALGLAGFTRASRG